MGYFRFAAREKGENDLIFAARAMARNKEIVLHDRVVRLVLATRRLE